MIIHIFPEFVYFIVFIFYYQSHKDTFFPGYDQLMQLVYLNQLSRSSVYSPNQLAFLVARSTVSAKLLVSTPVSF